MRFKRPKRPKKTVGSDDSDDGGEKAEWGGGQSWLKRNGMEPRAYVVRSAKERPTALLSTLTRFGTRGVWTGTRGEL